MCINDIAKCLHIEEVSYAFDPPYWSNTDGLYKTTAALQVTRRS